MCKGHVRLGSCIYHYSLMLISSYQTKYIINAFFRFFFKCLIVLAEIFIGVNILRCNSLFLM